MTADTPLSLRIQSGLERVATAMRADDWASARAADVNPAQLAVLSALDGRATGLAVREIAGQLGVSQPSATESISALERKGLVHRQRDAADARSVRVLSTPAGAAALAAAQAARSVGGQAVGALAPAQQQDLLVALVAMIRQLQDSGALPIQRMCVSCRHFRPNAHADAHRPHHCTFVDAAFGTQDLRMDCHEHETANPATRAATWAAFTADRGPLQAQTER
ncbi:MarR family transcriptional regulator [Devosia sp. FKR38]|uniref:MarR family winged helix-turn-helix transcriptional regulator n=1 Tax=Devosia sp. FKR38 TaxID=2562312 RepID=UPI0020C142D3|nr:MarR family transcriptional regulator [Devosia sp. FKR38]